MPNDNILPPTSPDRALQIRRDKDSQKNSSISLYDIDQTILNHLKNNLKLQVENQGVTKTVTCMFGSPELWKAMKQDSFIRDYQGKITLPCVVLKRTTSDSDHQFSHFNRYLAETFIRKHSPKNQYTRFSVLNGSSVPINEIYTITFPSHMKLTYHFVIWTEYVEQMNKLVEIFQFSTKDYWGVKAGFRFRVDAPTFGHAIELQSGDDRLVKTEFDLEVHGYILPETITMLDQQKSTFNKSLTPKKIILGMETDDTGGNIINDTNTDKWKNQQYSNVSLDEHIAQPPITVVEMDTDCSKFIHSALSTRLLMDDATTCNSGEEHHSHHPEGPYLRLVGTPFNINNSGQDGDVSFDDQYFYVYAHTQWRRVAISSFS